ncbi:Hint domain-containing protein [Tropicimonas sediminicola]|uniref:Hint domain-containing protein n=1 Tax=Tropicimonas sediminicola TaxID=1031541 RepID=A0A239D2F7_9RHOB|nr:Hint domain-containing protein [Tropicimonas sediminicola]SNS26487.1 Hint domain-containing protein [Tropicimonas sediminicola]
MAIELIVNGSFDDKASGWSGTDIEAHHTENTYQRNGSTDRVAEMNGGRTEITVMQQTFSVSDPVTTDLVFDAALRATGPVEAGTDGFTVELLDSDGNAILSETILPTTTDFVTYSFEITFPAAGDYTLRLTQIGPNDSYGALVDDISIMVCLADGTRIETPSGSRLIEDLAPGDVVSTSKGPLPIRWIGSRRVTAEEMAQNPKLRPIRIRAGALGHGLPDADLRTSRQHRMLVSSKIAQRMFHAHGVLVSAIRLTALPGIEIEPEMKGVRYFHMLFDEHVVVTANGAPTEALLAGPVALKALSPAAREEILTLFPEMADAAWCPEPAATIPSRKRQIRLVERHAKNLRTALIARPPGGAGIPSLA